MTLLKEHLKIFTKVVDYSMKTVFSRHIRAVVHMCSHPHETCTNSSHVKSTPVWRKDGLEVPAQEEELLVFENCQEKRIQFFSEV